MTNKRNIITLLIMLSLSQGIFAQLAPTSQTGLKKDNNQYSSQLTIWDDINGVAQYMIMRETYLSTEYFSIKSTLQDVYIAKLFNVSDSYDYNDTVEYKYNGNSTNTEITSIKSYSYEGNEDLITFLDMKTGISLGNDVTEIGFFLINISEPTSSYEIVLSVNPSIEITPQSFTDTNSLLESLEEESNYRTYLKKQVLGSNFFTATDNNPFPLMEINNDYTFRMSLTENHNVSRNNETINYNYFDVIYNRADNHSTELGGSLIQNLFSIYFNNSKPLFHHYINEYMESNGDNFNYRDYRTLTTVEGEELVNKALTYLTWGVEHTSDKNYKALGANSLLPSQVVNSNDIVNDWLTTPGETNNRTQNYLTYEPEVIYEAINDDEISYNEEMVNQLQDIAGEYFEAVDTRLEGIGLTTPFIDGNNRVTGSSLPYVKGGMDSPRTFNYKMMEQYQIISDYIEDDSKTYKHWYGKNEGEWTVNNHYFSLKGDNSDLSPLYFYFYNYDNFTTNEHKPFVPGYDNDDNYQYMNLAGVDSLGLLSGALAMTSYYNKIFSISNRKKFIELDNYYSMSHDGEENNLSFLQNNGMPNFHRTSFDNTYKSNYENLRFNRMDIERSTVIVPNLKDIQPGDLLVNTKDGETEVAIVVDPGYSEGDSIFHLSNVLVLSVNDLDKRVTLNYWGNGATYSSFTDRPKDFIVRRLIKYNGEDINNLVAFGEDDQWDPFSAPIMNVNTHLTFHQDNYSRWIPNTGELFELSSITFTSDDPELSFHDIPVVIGGLTDINYSTEESLSNNGLTGNNVNINKGDGFEFYAIIGDDNNKSYVKLATFNINTNSQNAQDRYLVNYVDEIFNSDGSPAVGFYLKTDGHTLHFYYKQGAGEDSGKSTEKFGIRPLTTNIRPGDDIVLNFDLKIGNNLVSAPGIKSQALGVYDKKMLWRANLYINDKDDWNNENPWNAPASGSITSSITSGGKTIQIQKFVDGFSDLDPDSNAVVYYGNNEWNVKYDGTSKLVSDIIEPDEGNYLSSLEQFNGEDNKGDGKQVVTFNEYTYIPSITGTPSDVAYAYGCADSPFEFNDELRQQQMIFNNLYSKSGIKFKNPRDEWPVSGITTRAEYIENVADYDLTEEEFNNKVGVLELTEYTKTTAKSGYSGYIKPSEFNDAFPDESLTVNNYIEDDVVKMSIFNEDSNLGSNFPFLPGWALEYHFQHNNVVPPNWINAISSGVDCNGFISRSASYSGENYLYGNSVNQKVTVKDKWFTSPDYPYYQSIEGKDIESYKISERRIGDVPVNLDKIKPGDLMYLENPDGTGSHIAMIQDVENVDVIGLENIKLIESTWYDEIEDGVYSNAKVVTLERKLENYSSKNWIIVRLKTE